MTFQKLSTSADGSGNVISSLNSSTATLAANATFTGTFENVLQYQEVSIEAVSNVDGTMFLDISSDGFTVLSSFPIITVTGVAFLRSALPQAFVRIRYTNGATLQTTFTLTTIYRPIAGGVTQVPINNSVFDATLASNTRSVIFSKDTNGNYNSIGMNLDGGLNVHVTDFPATQPISGTVDSWLSDGSGNDITSQVNGTQRALDVGIDVAGVQVDPRQIRTLTSSDIVTADQGGAPWSQNITQIAGSAISIAATGIAKVGLTDSSGTNITLAQKTMSSSVPVVIASDQVSAIPQVEYISRFTKNNQTYGFSATVAAATSGTDNPICLIRNPSGSGKVLYLFLAQAGTTVANVAFSFRLTANPTVLTNGTSQTPISLNVGGGAGASAMLVTTLPTVTLIGSILETIDVGQNNPAGEFGENFSIAINPNNSLLFTASPSSNNRNIDFTIQWVEL